MPCLNEAETLAVCVGKAKSFLEASGIVGEVLIADNGSTDGSQEIAMSGGARVVAVPQRGYGAALQAGIEAARGKYVIMGDADDSYDFTALTPFVERLRGGSDLVMGNRFLGGIDVDAMPFLHRYLGNPVLSWLGRLFFGIGIRDFHCGLRGFNRVKILSLNLRTTGMEFASEMVVRSSLEDLRIVEVATTLKKDGRSRPPHLRTWRDGWRHLSFLLMYSPRWLFLYPGLILAGLGLAGVIALLPGPLHVLGLVLDIHTYVVACFMLLIGAQAIGFAVVARRFAASHSMIPPSRRYSSVIAAMTLERVLIISVIVVIAGAAGLLWSLGRWVSVGFGPIEYAGVLRTLLISTTVLAIGVQSALTGFLSAITEVPTK